MFPESLENSFGSFVVEDEVVLGVNTHVVHVDFKPFFCDHVCADIVMRRQLP